MRIGAPSSFDPFALPQHGGDLRAAEARFGKPAAGWLDLSTGINPYAYPLPEIAPVHWHRLPDPGLEEQVRGIAAATYGPCDPERVVTAPGSQALIQLLPRLRPQSRVAIVGPTYGEHATCWGAAGHRVIGCESLDGAGEAEVVVVVNPNNPDGQRHEPAQLLQVAERLAHRDGLLVVDEAFGETAPELSVAGRAGPGLAVLRSFGKFFGLAGLRLGFLFADPVLASQMRSTIGPWAASGPALAVAAAALADRKWIADMRRRLVREASILDLLLTQARLSVVGGTPLFRLVNAPRAWALYEHLGQQGILVRPFDASPRWLRFGLPPGDEGRARLQESLAAWGK